MKTLINVCIEQWSPTFLAPGTGFMEDNFSTDRGGGIVQAVMQVLGSDEEWQMKLCSLPPPPPPPVVRPGY